MKIALLGHGRFSNYSYRMLQPILEDKGFEIVLMILNQPKQKTFKQKLISSWKKGRRGYLLIIITEAILKKIKAKFGKISEDEKDYNSEDYYNKKQIPILKTQKLYTYEIIEQIKIHKADILVLVDFHRIIRDQLITIFPQGILSYHYGNMRKYRGQPPAFWELYNGEEEMGVTVQKINTGIDCGQPIEEITIKFDKQINSISSISKWIDKECPSMMYKALKKIEADYQTKIIKEYGKLYTVPTLRQWIAFQFNQLFNIYR